MKKSEARELNQRALKYMGKRMGISPYHAMSAQGDNQTWRHLFQFARLEVERAVKKAKRK